MLEMVDLASVGALVSVLVSLCVVLFTIRRCIVFVSDGEQLRVQGFTTMQVYNDPGIKIIGPFYRSCERVKASVLGEKDYKKITDQVTGKERIERGPKMLMLGPHDRIVASGTGVSMSKTQYVTYLDEISGVKKTVRGPQIWFPGPHDRIVGAAPAEAISLMEDEYVRITDSATGERTVKRGKDLVFLEPTQVASSVTKVWTLKSFEYVRLQDSVTGKIRVERGEKTVVPGPDEQVLESDRKTTPMQAVDLQVDDFVKIEDQTTGEIRVERGVKKVVLGPNDRFVDGGKKKAVKVDEERAVMVRDNADGQLRLVTEKQLFIPGPTEDIESIQELIKLSDHEAMITKDKEGNLHFHYGNPAKQKVGRGKFFYLQPYEEVFELWWSSGLRRLKRDLRITRFDTRSQYMWMEIDVRTSDNVELVLEVTFFWEAVDLEKMVRTTGNLPGDMFNQARSQFIKNVALTTLKSFMEELHGISKRIFEGDAPFYESRGVKIHSLEVTRYTCKDQRTSEVLQQIIEETTNRLNRLSQAESENEVNIFRMQGQIEQEKLNSGLLEIQREHSKDDARVQGHAEAERVAAFLTGLEKEAPKLEDRIAMWQVLRKTEALGVVSNGGAKLFYTPSDVDLSIKAGEGA